jgi:squalene-hopene/tetraprenyl-beta-curcumene cyclase
MTNGVKWLLDLQNRDGGWPTFCRGWGTLPFDRSSNDITAHVLRAIVLWAEMTSNHGTQTSRAKGAVERGFQFLTRKQRSDGSWLPLWFGNQRAPEDENPTYGTAKVLAAFRDCGRLESPAAHRGLDWLEANQNADGGWGGGSDTPSTVEETSLAVEALIEGGRCGSNLGLGLNWLVTTVESQEVTRPQPIGFYFAKLWYYEDLYPLIFAVSALHSASRTDYNTPTLIPEAEFGSSPLTLQKH